MKHYIAVFFALIALGFDTLITFADSEDSAQAVDIRYLEPIGDLYRTIEFVARDKQVRILHGHSSSGGAFERDPVPNFSPDHSHILLTQIESDNIEMPNGLVVRHEVAYCNIIDLRTGCIIARETGEFCGGIFTADGKWKNAVYPDFDLFTETPRATSYLEGKLTPADSLNTSFENLMACDPPNEGNTEAYRMIIKERVFDLNSKQIKTFEGTLRAEN